MANEEKKGDVKRTVVQDKEKYSTPFPKSGALGSWLGSIATHLLALILTLAFN